jgi:hypothetical protein
LKIVPKWGSAARLFPAITPVMRAEAGCFALKQGDLTMSNIHSAPIGKNPFIYLSVAMLAALICVSALRTAPIDPESPPDIILAATR